MNQVFDQISEVQHREQQVSLFRLNQFIASDSAQTFQLSHEAFLMATLVFNCCNSAKPKKIVRSAFVNYYLPLTHQMPLDLSSIMHANDQSKADDASVNDLFSQIRGEVKPNEAFQKSFNVDPRISQGIAKMFAQNMFSSVKNPSPPQPQANNVSTVQQPPTQTGGVFEGFFGMFGGNNQQTDAGTSSKNQPSAQNTKDPGYDEIADRPARNPIFSASKMASVRNDNSKNLGNNFNEGNPTSNHNKNQSADNRSMLGNKDSKQPLQSNQANNLGFAPLLAPQGQDDESYHFQHEFSMAKGNPDSFFNVQAKQVKAMDESSFMNYQEIGPSDSYIQNEEEIKAKMNPNVRTNLKRFEYDF